MLCFVDSELPTPRLHNPKQRSAIVPLQMSFLETPPPAGVAPVWTALDDEQRAEVVATLARLIAKVAVGRNDELEAETTEKSDE